VVAPFRRKDRGTFYPSFEVPHILLFESASWALLRRLDMRMGDGILQCVVTED
jgi:hypothetical protein